MAKREPIRVTKGGIYTPKWGNEGYADKIAVHYRFLSFAEQQALLDPADIGKSFAYESRVLAAMIGKVENLSVADDDGVREITSGRELVDEPGLDKLAMELWLYFRGISAMDAEKKSESGSESISGQPESPESESERKSATDS